MFKSHECPSMAENLSSCLQISNNRSRATMSTNNSVVDSPTLSSSNNKLIKLSEICSNLSYFNELVARSSNFPIFKLRNPELPAVKYNSCQFCPLSCEKSWRLKKGLWFEQPEQQSLPSLENSSKGYTSEGKTRTNCQKILWWTWRRKLRITSCSFREMFHQN